jgi:hypothetical protein
MTSAEMKGLEERRRGFALCWRPLGSELHCRFASGHSGPCGYISCLSWTTEKARPLQ